MMLTSTLIGWWFINVYYSIVVVMIPQLFYLLFLLYHISIKVDALVGLMQSRFNGIGQPYCSDLLDRLLSAHIKVKAMLVNFVLKSI